MSETVQYDKLVLLNSIYNNSITAGKYLPQSSIIKTTLLPHQLAMVNGMHMYRDKLTRGFLIGNRAINGKIGIIGDPPGTGKTLSILAYLSSQVITYPRITCELTSNSSKYFFSHDLHQLMDNATANLVIVPQNLLQQWKYEIEKHTSMTYISIESRRILKDTNLAKNIVNKNLVLTTNKCYKYIQEFVQQNNIEWNNIIIDEASSIYFSSSDPPLRFQFLWLVTNNWIPLIFKNPVISRKNLYNMRDRISIHPDLNNWLLDDGLSHYESTLVSSSFLKEYLPFFHENRSQLILKSSNDLLTTSMSLINYLNETMKCRSNVSLNSLSSYYLSRNTDPDIESKQIPNLFQALGVEYKTVNEYLLDQPINKHNLIQRKAIDNECVICLEPCEYPTCVNCCYNIFCAKCLLKNTIITQKCPTCRDVVGITNMCCLDNFEGCDNIISKNKADTCLDILSKNKGGKFIIYSSFDNIYYQLFEEINELGLKAERLENNMISIMKTINNYKEGKSNVIFVSNIDLIRGHSLQSTSHLIFYHEQPSYELKKILIHSAQRIGRTHPLKIIYLNSEVPV
jgi:hypothetical protein